MELPSHPGEGTAAAGVSYLFDRGSRQPCGLHPFAGGFTVMRDEPQKLLKPRENWNARPTNEKFVDNDSHFY